MKSFISLLSAGLLGLVSALPTAQETPNGIPPFEVNFTTAGVQDRVWKRGVGYNDPNFPQFFKDEAHSKVWWMYNWWSEPGGRTNTWFEYVPTLHSNRDEHTRIWFDNFEACSAHGGPLIHVFGFNEPDQCGNGGSCMQDIQTTVNAHKQWIEPLRKYGKRIEIVSPSVTNGARSSEGTIMGLAYLKEFLNRCNGCKIDYVGVHWYDRWNNVEYFKKHVTDAHQIAGGKYVWITEFAPVDGSEAQKIEFLKQVLPWLDAQPWVYRYAYQMAATGSLINAEGTGLSALGQVYNTYG